MNCDGGVEMKQRAHLGVIVCQQPLHELRFDVVLPESCRSMKCWKSLNMYIYIPLRIVILTPATPHVPKSRFFLFHCFRPMSVVTIIIIIIMVIFKRLSLKALSALQDPEGGGGTG